MASHEKKLVTRAACRTPDQLISEEVLTIWPFDTNSHTPQGRVFVSNGQIGERYQKAIIGSFASGSILRRELLR